MRIYGDLVSGNCLKVKYAADHLRLPYSWVDIDVMKGETRTPAFLARSPMGQVPVVEFADGRVIAQSNAILRYLAHGSALLPEDSYEAAKVDEWLFWEQYSHEPYIAVCRFQMLYLGRGKDERDPARVERGEKALDLMDGHLSGRAFCTGGAMTIADIALLAYTRFAHEGGFDLASRSHVRSWIGRCEETLHLTPARAA